MAWVWIGQIGEVGDRDSEGQAAGVYGAGFTAGSLAGKVARIGTRGTGNKIGSDKELMVGRMAEGDRGKQGRRLRVEGSDIVTFFEDTPQGMKTRVVASD